MVEYSQPRVQYEQMVQKIDDLKFYLDVISIQGVQGAIQERPEPIPELKNIKKMKKI